jgi:hypothetical protein
MRTVNVSGWAQLVFILAAVASQAATAKSAEGTVDPGACPRACLETHVDRFLQALAARQPAQLPWTSNARYTENNVVLEIGDGFWGTASAVGTAAQGVKFADPARGQVAYFGAMEERGDSVYVAVRLRIEAGRVAEAETIVNRKSETGARGDPARLRHDPELVETVAPAERVAAGRMIDLANGYFSTMQLNDGKLFTVFDDECARQENGAAMANDPTSSDPLRRMGCAEQFKLGFFRFDDRVREREFPLVDEERGIVLARGFIDHAGRLEKYPLADGTIRESRVKAPHAWHFLEAFKIRNGRIRKIEAVFIYVPYGMPSPWTDQ